MSLTKHSTMLDLIYADDTVQYSGKVMPAGSVACMALNISKEDLAAAKPLCQQIAPAEVTLLFPFVDEKDMESARIAAHSLVRIISRYELFSFFDVPNIDQWLDQVFSMKTVSRIPEFSKILSSGQMDDQKAEKYGPEITLQILAPFKQTENEGCVFIPVQQIFSGGDSPWGRKQFLDVPDECFNSVYSRE